MISQENALRSQAEQCTIELLTQRKGWGESLSEKTKALAELNQQIASIEEEEADMALELKVSVAWCESWSERVEEEQGRRGCGEGGDAPHPGGVRAAH